MRVTNFIIIAAIIIILACTITVTSILHLQSIILTPVPRQMAQLLNQDAEAPNQPP